MSKLQLCRQDFLLEALSIHQPPNIVPPKEHVVGTAAIWDFCFVSPDVTRVCQRINLNFREGVISVSRCAPGVTIFFLNI